MSWLLQIRLVFPFLFFTIFSFSKESWESSDISDFSLTDETLYKLLPSLNSISSTVLQLENLLTTFLSGALRGVLTGVLTGVLMGVLMGVLPGESLGVLMGVARSFRPSVWTNKFACD